MDHTHRHPVPKEAVLSTVEVAEEQLLAYLQIAVKLAAVVTAKEEELREEQLLVEEGVEQKKVM